MVAMNAVVGWAALTGLGAGTGLWLMAATVTRIGRPRLLDRVAPYLVDISESARERVERRGADPLPIIGLLLAPMVTGARRMLNGLSGGGDTVRLRLRQAGSALSVEAHRSRQLVWLLLGAGAGAATIATPTPASDAAVPVRLGMVVAFAGAGLLASDWLLVRAARRRLARIEEELPTTLEFLALSLSAGESVYDAMRRVAVVSRGDLAGEFGSVIAAMNAGVSFPESLRQLDQALRTPSLSRVIDQLLAALDRGSPLAEVLRAQAQDARDQSRRRLLESAGRKEVAMLVPLVFMILPVTVLFAIYPGVAVLQLGL